MVIDYTLVAPKIKLIVTTLFFSSNAIIEIITFLLEL